MDIWLSRIYAIVIGLVVSMLIGMIYLYPLLLLIRYLLMRKGRSIDRLFNKKIVFYEWIIVLVLAIIVLVSYLDGEMGLTISTSIYTAVTAVATGWTAIYYTIKRLGK